VQADGAAAFAPDPAAAGWQAAVDDLLRARALEDDYDGQGSAAPGPATVDGAIALARILCGRRWPPPDRTLAGVNGTVFFEWFDPSGFTSVEVTGPRAAVRRFIPPGARVAEHTPLPGW
jgi:hypothetical protein